jgi:hypothetical protein
MLQALHPETFRQTTDSAGVTNWTGSEMMMKMNGNPVGRGWEGVGRKAISRAVGKGDQQRTGRQCTAFPRTQSLAG